MSQSSVCYYDCYGAFTLQPNMLPNVRRMIRLYPDPNVPRIVRFGSAHGHAPDTTRMRAEYPTIMSRCQPENAPN